MKTYLVQTWDAQGALSNSYEVTIENARELAELKTFLRQKSAHVLVTRKPNKRASAAKRR